MFLETFATMNILYVPPWQRPLYTWPDSEESIMAEVALGLEEIYDELGVSETAHSDTRQPSCIATDTGIFNLNPDEEVIKRRNDLLERHERHRRVTETMNALYRVAQRED